METELLETLMARLKPQFREIGRRSKTCEVRENFDDLLQDLFLKLIEHPSPSRYNAEAYAVKTFKNLVKDKARSCYRRSARELVFLKGRDEEDPSSVSDRISRRDLRRQIKVLVRSAQLKRDYRCALWAWMRDRLHEFARRRNIDLTTATVWACRARAHLRQHNIESNFFLFCLTFVRG